jgi:hypothetical protein
MMMRHRLQGAKGAGGTAPDASGEGADTEEEWVGYTFPPHFQGNQVVRTTQCRHAVP